MKYVIPTEQRTSAIKILTSLYRVAFSKQDRQLARSLKRLVSKLSINSESVDVKVKDLSLMCMCLDQMLEYTKGKELSKETAPIRDNVSILVETIKVQFPQCAL